MILSIDSSGLTASVALIDTEKDIAIAEYTVNLKKTHSETLLPMIDAIYRLTGLDKADTHAVAVAAGPGSFTGLRIGGAAAKGIASALDIPVIPVPTVDGLAYNCFGYGGYICPVMDARRGQTYTGIYLNEGYELKTVLRQCAISIEEVISRLNNCEKEVMFLGDGVPVFRGILDEKLTVDHIYAPAGMNRQSAVSVGRLGAKLYREGQYISAADFAPEYLRQSQAERELQEGVNGQ
ncbi:MAG: tRNA (adenosine(37)-N6)-threonylcarbamoyltransferase complex dimerization subunit type 1 TsaB [Lachnospiraceae bacterium]|nr:tRNA (adenosine(37)-N6)-threonylcarbamoyltransferase complex dimerization subunit type 1 TsaB [Lachnospiraceae bacterium]